MRSLLVLRHAKSDWDAGAHDHERPLNRRGLRSAELIGEHVTAAGIVPDVAIASSAVRARSTLQLAAAAGAWDSELVVTDELYDTDVTGALAVIAAAPDVARLMVVGHEPTWSSLVQHLTGADVAVKTATLVQLELSVRSWRGDLAGAATIVSVTQARHLDHRLR